MPVTTRSMVRTAKLPAPAISRVGKKKLPKKTGERIAQAQKTQAEQRKISFDKRRSGVGKSQIKSNRDGRDYMSSDSESQIEFKKGGRDSVYVVILQKINDSEWYKVEVRDSVNKPQDSTNGMRVVVNSAPLSQSHVTIIKEDMKGLRTKVGIKDVDGWVRILNPEDYGTFKKEVFDHVAFARLHTKV